MCISGHFSRPFCTWLNAVGRSSSRTSAFSFSAVLIWACPAKSLVISCTINLIRVSLCSLGRSKHVKHCKTDHPRLSAYWCHQQGHSRPTKRSVYKQIKGLMDPPSMWPSWTCIVRIQDHVYSYSLLPKRLLHPQHFIAYHHEVWHGDGYSHSAVQPLRDIMSPPAGRGSHFFATTFPSSYSKSQHAHPWNIWNLEFQIESWLDFMEFTQISMQDPPSLPSCLDQVWFLWLYEQLPSALSENSTPPTKNTAQAELEVWRSIKKIQKGPVHWLIWNKNWLCSHQVSTLQISVNSLPLQCPRQICWLQELSRWVLPICCVYSRANLGSYGSP